jgi:hypothetical protein
MKAVAARVKSPEVPSSWYASLLRESESVGQSISSIGRSRDGRQRDVPKVMRNALLQCRDAPVRTSSSVRQHVVNNQREPVPLSNQAVRDGVPPNRRLVDGEVARAREKFREGRTEGSIADQRRSGFEEGVEAPATDAVEEHAEEEPLEEGRGTGDEGAARHEEDSVCGQ